MRLPIAPRWIAVVVFTLFTALNYLDRQTLAALAPQVKAEFHLSNEDYGWLQSAFSIVYALTAPFAGWYLDRFGLTAGAIFSIAAWSLAAMSTAFVDTFAGLAVCRMLLGAAEAGAIPAFGKASATYLPSRERALGTGLNSLGVSLGNMAAPLLAGGIAVLYGWRMAFAATGVLGLFWIPLWLAVQRKVPVPLDTAASMKAAPPATARQVLADRNLWAIVAGNMLAMTTFSLWLNWTTIFLVERYQLTQQQANQGYAWIPPIFATAGGLFGGWLAMRAMNQGATWRQARNRVIRLGSILVLCTAAVPLMPAPAYAIAVVSLSFFFTMAVSANVYALPQDLFGPQRTGLAVAAITCGYGLMLAVFSPLTGRLVDRYGFIPICVICALLPLLGWLLLQRTALRAPVNRIEAVP
jgi:ACS family hexuronate transporter-like MFS transporter